MQIYTCRDQTNTLRLCKGRGQWQDMQPDGTIRDTIVVSKGKTDAALILVHGFNTSLNTLRVAYTQLGVNIKAIEPKAIDVFGFSWPAQVAPAYITAYNQCDGAAAHLLAMVRSLRALGYNDIHILCHSMGSIVTMRMIELAEVGEVKRVAIEQGDAYAESFEDNARYGKKCARKIKALFSYYSKGDEVLGVFARLLFFFRPGTRLGAVKLDPRICPTIYQSFDAQSIHKAEVDHSTFLTSEPLIRHAVIRLTGALSAGEVGP